MSSGGGLRELVEFETANDCIEEQQTTLLVAKSRGHFMRAAFDLTEQQLYDIVGANRLPMLLWKRIEGQTGLQIALQALNGTGID